MYSHTVLLIPVSQSTPVDYGLQTQIEELLSLYQSGQVGSKRLILLYDEQEMDGYDRACRIVEAMPGDTVNFEYAPYGEECDMDTAILSAVRRHMPGNVELLVTFVGDWGIFARLRRKVAYTVEPLVASTSRGVYRVCDLIKLWIWVTTPWYRFWHAAG